MMAYSVFWIVQVSLISLMSTFKKNKIFILIVIGLCLILFSGLRGPGVDNDYDVYQVYFDAVNSFSDVVSNEYNVESWFNVLTLTVKNLGGDLNILMLFVASVSIVIKIRFYIKLSPVHWVALLSYISYFFILQEMTQIRAGLASGFYLMAIYYHGYGYRKRYYLLCSIATLFHLSFIVTLLTEFLLIGSNRKILILLILTCFSILLSVVGYSSAKPLLLLFSNYSSKATEYLNIMSMDDVNAINIYNVLMLTRIILSVTIACLCLFYKINFNKKFLQLYLFGVFIFYLFSDSSALAFRLSDIYFVVEPVFMAYMVHNLLLSNKNKLFGIFVSFFAFLYVTALFFKMTEILKPYVIG